MAGILWTMHKRPQEAVEGLRTLLGAAVGVGGGLLAYTFVEPCLFRFNVRHVPLDTPRVDVLHLSDAHLGSGQHRRREFLSSLPGRLERPPELILATGDMIETNSGIDPLLETLEPFEASWGKFYVNGSHDYYQAQFMSYRKYFGDAEQTGLLPSDFGRLKAGLDRLGWTSLTNRQEVLDTPIGPVRLSGVDDPYLKRHSTAHLGTDRGDALRIGLMHAPDVVSEFALEGFELILAGHTHGGQVRFPLIGAVVTNSSLPTALACGLHRVGGSWLHVSPGLGHGTFSPIRFLTRPEATLLRLGRG